MFPLDLCNMAIHTFPTSEKLFSHIFFSLEVFLIELNEPHDVCLKSDK